MPIRPLPVDPVPTLPPLVLHIVSVAPGWSMLGGEDGSVWIVPAYTFKTTDGASLNVIAIPDNLITGIAPSPGTSILPPRVAVPMPAPAVPIVPQQTDTGSAPT
jgi:hypothetical protein